MAKRAAKRARAEEPSASASSSSTAGPYSAAVTDASGGGEEANHFARLPDELVQRIFSELEATEAYEKCQLWSLDQRFRRLVPGVHWQQLRLEPSKAGACDRQKRLETFRRRLDRFSARARSGALAGCRRLAVGAARVFSGTCTSKEHVEACIDAACAITKLLAALSVVSAPLESVHFFSVDWTDSWDGWPAEVKQRQLGIAAPQSLRHVASAFLAALQPAPLRSLEVEDRALSLALLDAAAPGCLPHLRELSMRRFAPPTAQHTSKLVETWPNLAKISCSVQNGEALKELSRLPLEELRVNVESLVEGPSELALEEALEALSADCVRLLELPLSDPDEPFERTRPISPRALASILRFRNLEELALVIDHTSSDALVGPANRQKLRSATLEIDVVDAPNGGAAVLQAAAGALAAAPRLETLTLDVISGGVVPDVSSLAGLIRVARPTLERLYLRGNLSSAEVLREVARVGPKLETVLLFHNAAEVTSLLELHAFSCSELLSMPTDDGRLEVVLDIHGLPAVLLQQALSMLWGWFHVRAPFISVRVNGKIV